MTHDDYEDLLDGANRFAQDIWRSFDVWIDFAREGDYWVTYCDERSSLNGLTGDNIDDLYVHIRGLLENFDD